MNDSASARTFPFPAPRRTPGSILFLCGMNSIRSPIAAAIARKVLPPGIFIDSAGVRRGERDPFVDAVLAEIGLSLDDHQPRTLEDLADTYFDLIITMAPQAHHAALELTRSSAIEVEYWPTADPSTVSGSRQQILAAYRETRDRVAADIERLRIALGGAMPEARKAGER